MSEIIDPKAEQFRLANRQLAGIVGVVLTKHYPGRTWGVYPQAENGIIDIFLADASTRMGYTIHLLNKSILELERDALFAGGEILERFNLSRGVGFNPDAIHTLKRDIRGHAVEL